jgi:PAS domain S-box-containing protein
MGDGEAATALISSVDRFRSRLDDALKPLGDPVEVQATAARLLGEELGASRVHYGEIGEGGEEVVVRVDHAVGVPSVAGRYQLASFGAAVGDAFRAGETLVIDDVAADARLGDEERDTILSLQVGAVVATCLVKDGRLAGLLVAHHLGPHAWTAEEIAKIEETAERTWAASERATAAEALRERDERYRTLFDAIDHGFCVIEMILDPDGQPVDYRIVEGNPKFSELTGLPATGEQTVLEMMPGLERFWVDTYGRIAATRQPLRFENYAGPMGKWFEVYAFPFGNPERRQVGILFSDVTEARRTQQALRESSERLQLAMEAAKAGSFDIPLDEAGPVKVTGAVSRLFGFAPEEGRRAAEYLERVHPDDREDVARAIREAFEQGVGHTIEYRIVRPDGSVVWVSSSAHLAPPVDGAPARLVGILIDITQRRQAEEAVREGATLVQTIAENATSGLFMIDEQGYCTYANASGLAMTGYDVWEIRSKPLHDLIHHHYPDGRPYPKHECPIDRALPENFDVRAHEDLFFRKDGSSFPVLCAASPIFRDGKPVSTVVEVRDITAAKEAERELREREERFRVLADAMPQLVWTADADGNVTYYNTRVSHYEGFSQSGDGRWEWQPVLHPDDLDLTVRAWESAVATRQTYQVRHRVRMTDGTFRWHLSRAFYVESGGTGQWYGTATDIHDLAQAEEAVRESEERFRAMANGMPLVVWVHDAEGRQEFVNETFCDFFGVTREEMTEGHWKTLMHPEDAQAYADEFERCLRERRPFQAQVRVRRGDGEWRWFESWGRPRFSASGEFMGIVGASADVTERKQIEERTRRLNEELESQVAARTAELLATNEQLQGFTYSVAHDLRQQIRGINANASILLLDLKDGLGPESRRILERLVGSSKQLGALVDDLLTYARLGKQAPTRQSLDLSALAEEVATVVIERGVCGAGTQFRIEPGLTASGDASMLRLVLENLLDNACKYSAEREAPLVEVGRDGEAFFVRDNGIGFEMRFASKLFQPFERLHVEGRYSGTGIGLANVRRIVEKHGGRVWAESEVDEGATFYFTLPDV